MEKKIEYFIDTFLESMFGSFSTEILIADIIFGLVFITFGVSLLKKNKLKIKIAFGWTFMALGCFCIISSIVQLLLLFK